MDTLTVRVVPATDFAPHDLEGILTLCRDTYGEDLAHFFRTFRDPVHVLGYQHGYLVSHALWITRWLQVGTDLPLRTAYVEAVATAPAHQHRGHASTIMHRLAASLGHFELAALCASTQGEDLYARLGWEPWRGPLFIRHKGEVIPTPGQRVMILRLPHTPPLDLDAPLSAEWREGELW
jgi:aminoglycoside 2'-N-acetyltransferase I